MRTGLELALKAFDSFKSNGQIKGASSATAIITKITSTLGGLPTKLFNIGAKAGKSLGEGLGSIGGWLYNKAKGVWDSFMSGFGKDGGVFTISQEYEADATTGKPLTVWDYGKDALKTISLANLETDVSEYANSALISNNSYSQNYLSSYNSSSSITKPLVTANDNLSDKLDVLIDLLSKSRGDTYVNVEVKNGNPQEIIKVLDNYLKPRSKKW